MNFHKTYHPKTEDLGTNILQNHVKIYFLEFLHIPDI